MHAHSYGYFQVNAAALRVLQLARLDKVFTIHASLEDVLDAG